MSLLDKPIEGLPAAIIRVVVFVPIGLVALVLSIQRIHERVTFVNRAVATDGVVVRKSEPLSTDEAAQPAFIEFRDQAGHTYRFSQMWFFSGARIGSSQPVLYDPDAPIATAVVNRFGPVWASALWLVPMGIGFPVLPIIELLGAIKTARRRSRPPST